MLFKISALTGRRLDDCAFLVLRSKWEDFADDETTEWLVVRRRGTTMRVVAKGALLPLGLWMSPRRELYLVGAHAGINGLHHGVEVNDDFRWTRITDVHPSTGITLPYGVWGLTDDCVFAWGGGWLAEDLASSHLNPALTWFFDGSTWREVRSPGPIQSVHGADRGSIFATGERGLIARWSGVTWVEMARPTHLPLGRLHVVSADEAYAATPDGELFEGSQHGWHSLATGGGSINVITRRGADVVLATQGGGMKKLEGSKVVSFHDRLNSYLAHAGETLMWTNGAGLMETRDFSTYGRVGDTELEALVNADYFPY